MVSDKGNCKYRYSDVDSRIPLPVKVVALTILTGIVVWIVVDNVLTAKFRDIFHARLIEDLSDHSMEDRYSMDRYLSSFQELPRIIIRQKDFIDYIEKQSWSEHDEIQIKRQNQYPDWLPVRSFMRILSRPRTILLLDGGGRTREIYQLRHEEIPQSLITLSPLTIEKSRNQALMTYLDDVPYLVTAEPYYSPGGHLKALLLVSSPLDNEFLLDVLIPLQHRHLVALAGSEERAFILASSNPDILPAGTSISSLSDRYLITGSEYFDYGASEIQVKFFSFAPLEEINDLTEAVISKERRERAVLAASLIFATTIIMYIISKRLHLISEQVANFSHQILGIKQLETPKGDQINILKERFQRLAGEVLQAREIIKSQAEEKTRLIVDNAFDAIITTDNHGAIESWNPQAEKMFGRTCDNAAGRPIYDIIVPEQYHDLFRNYLSRCNNTLSCEIPGEKIEISVLDQSNREFPVEMSVSSVLFEDRCIFIFVIRNITERREAEAKVLYYQEELRTLMSKLSVVEEQERKRLSERLHDNISQNLAISKIKLEGMVENSPGMAGELTEIRELIEQTIKFIRSLTFDMSPPVLYELGFSAAVEWLTEQYNEKYNLQITYINTRTFTGPEGETGVLLFKTIRELLMNVVKHSGTKQVKLIISGDGDIININVEDNGAGFDTSDLGTLLTRTESFGILSIRERIRYLKGAIEISSSPGSGTKVNISVPLKLT